jgi:hypothetical protein
MSQMHLPSAWGSRVANLAGMAATAVTAAALPAASLAQGCAMCATYLSNGQDPRSEAFKVSILFLMSMPFVVVGSVGAWILWMYRRNRPRRPALQVLRAEQEGAS